MAENETGNGATNEAQASNAPQVGVITQYVKDLSFENPNAPQSFQAMNQNKPNIDVNVSVGAKKLSEDTYEVDLQTTINAKHGEENTFVIELVYAGLFGIKNLPEEALQPFLLVQAPMMLFPFARRVIADASRDGGFPPLLLDPIDFSALFQQSVSQAQKEAAEKQAAGETAQ